jgi:hypothetical protein
VIPGLGQLIGAIIRHTVGRWTRRARAHRELEQIRADINGCAAIFASTQGGTIQPILLPVASSSYLSALHGDGFLSVEGLEVIQEFLTPAEQANFLLTIPSQHGPPGLAGAQRLACLLRGKTLTETRDENGVTLRDRALGEVASALTAMQRQWWKV